MDTLNGPGQHQRQWAVRARETCGLNFSLQLLAPIIHHQQISSLVHVTSVISYFGCAAQLAESPVSSSELNSVTATKTPNPNLQATRELPSLNFLKLRVLTCKRGGQPLPGQDHGRAQHILPLKLLAWCLARRTRGRAGALPAGGSSGRSDWALGVHCRGLCCSGALDILRQSQLSLGPQDSEA